MCFGWMLKWYLVKLWSVWKDVEFLMEISFQSIFENFSDAHFYTKIFFKIKIQKLQFVVQTFNLLQCELHNQYTIKTHKIYNTIQMVSDIFTVYYAENVNSIMLFQYWWLTKNRFLSIHNSSEQIFIITKTWEKWNSFLFLWHKYFLGFYCCQIIVSFWAEFGVPGLLLEHFCKPQTKSKGRWSLNEL